MRKKIDVDENSQEGTDANIQIILEQAQEQLNNKNINVEQYGKMVKQIFEINESKKLREAQRIEKNSKKVNQNDEHTPISDEEARFSNSDSDVDLIKQNRIRLTKNKLRQNMEEMKKTSGGSIISSFAKATAAELRNTNNGDRKESRWAKGENQSRWSNIWDNKPQMHLMQPINNNTWNIRPGIPNMSIPPPPNPPQTLPIGMPGITPFIGNPAVNIWHNNPAFNQFDLKPQVVPQYAPIVNSDVMRTINIDQISREIRFYDDIAIAFMNWDEPKEIGFQSGQRRVVVDDKDSIILGFNEPCKSFIIDGKEYQIRLGSPTRELYIDGVWYECFFGEPPIGIQLDNKMRIFKIDGPAPPVKIGNLRQDLVVGKINMIIDAKDMVPVFLDSKVQFFEILGETNSIQFADYLLTVIINDEPISIEFGGLPKSLFIRGRKHFVRFTALPNGIVPGKVFIRNMVRTPLHRDVVSPPAPAIVSLNDVPQPDQSSSILNAPIANLHDSIVPSTVPDATLNNPSASSVPVVNQSESTLTNSSMVGARNADMPQASLPSASNPLGNINIDDLFQKLLATGIINKPVVAATAESEKDPKEAPKDKEIIKPVNLLQPETIKKRQSAIVFQLFSGMQCSSCGVRFPPEQTMKYSQHLDWHFRQNRRDRDSVRRAHSRQWYYDVSDWIQYEEIEDLEEREKNWFETQQTEMDLGQEDTNQKSESPPPSCPAGPDGAEKTCDMCHDPFEQFYHEETEEWHLRSALRIDDKIYHPLCYEDYKVIMVSMFNFFFNLISYVFISKLIL